MLPSHGGEAAIDGVDRHCSGPKQPANWPRVPRRMLRFRASPTICGCGERSLSAISAINLPQRHGLLLCITARLGRNALAGQTATSFDVRVTAALPR